jgi:hypothetical protein
MTADYTFFKKWAKMALFNFMVVAAIGVLLRYKILFPLPLVDQKHLLHGHSHFAFAGWVSLALYLAVIYMLQPQERLRKRLEWLLVAQQMSSYGMLFTFPFTGYAAGSIAFSTASIFISYFFAWLVIRELLTQPPTPEKKWLITGMLCNVLSSLGTFVLAYLMMTKNLRQDWYFGSVYFFLHFQYNGFFLFTIGAMFVHFLNQWMTVKDVIASNRLFQLLIIAFVPAWFLSLMWMRIPAWMYYAGVVAALIQLAALWYFLKLIVALRSKLAAVLQPLVKWFWLTAGFAFAVKIILQSLSAVPQLNVYAFGLRPIIIGFLHLALLAFVSVFIMSWLFQMEMLQLTHRLGKRAAWLFLGAVVFNEILLMLQGVVAVFSKNMPYTNMLLLFAAFLIFTSLCILIVIQLKTPTVTRRAAGFKQHLIFCAYALPIFH